MHLSQQAAAVEAAVETTRAARAPESTTEMQGANAYKNTVSSALFAKCGDLKLTNLESTDVDGTHTN